MFPLTPLQFPSCDVTATVVLMSVFMSSLFLAQVLQGRKVKAGKKVLQVLALKALKVNQVLQVYQGTQGPRALLALLETQDCQDLRVRKVSPSHQNTRV